MKRLLTAVLLWGALVPATQAVVVSATGDDQGNGSIVIDPPNLNEINVTKVFTALNDPAVMLLTVVVDAPGIYAVTETITNDTGSDWDGFTWLMSNAEGVFFFDFLDPPGTGPFANSTPDGNAASSTASVFGGILADGQTMDLNIQVLVTGIPEGEDTLGFSIIQVPSAIAAPIPLPSAGLLLGLGGIPALFAVVRPRRS